MKKKLPREFLYKGRNSEDLKSCRYEVSQSEDGAVTLHIQGRMDASNAGRMIEGIKSLLKDRLPSSLTVDLEKVTYLDDFGALVLVELKYLMTGAKDTLHLTNASDKVKDVLSILNFDTIGERVSFTKKRSPNMFTRLGEGVFRQASDLTFTFAFIGSVCLSLLYVCLHPKSLRTNDTFLNMEKMGVDALPIVGLISFLLGLIMASPNNLVLVYSNRANRHLIFIKCLLGFFESLFHEKNIIHMTSSSMAVIFADYGDTTPCFLFCLHPCVQSL